MENIIPESTYLWALLYLLMTVSCVVHVLLNKRDPRAAMGWVMACIFVPYGGSLSYFLFGINRVRTRARGLKQGFASTQQRSLAKQSCQENRFRKELWQIGGRVVGCPLTTGNEVIPLFNGDTAYPAMLGAIANAKQRIFFSTYIFKTDETGLRFAQALETAVKRGVEVKVLIDGIGEMYSFRKASAMLKRRGINTARFLPPSLIPPSVYINLRNHRKVLIIDDHVAYAGGMNIDDGHVNLKEKERSISDVHFFLGGPVVADLTELFAHDWFFTTGESINGQYQDSHGKNASMRCRVVPDGPDDELDALALTLQTVISAAKVSVDIMTPYFLPSRELIASLQSAALRGLRVRIVLPEKNNLFYVHWAHRNMLQELLRRGVEAYYQPEPFCHSKLFCVDHEYSLIGSANIDPRSLRLNFELGIEVFSEKLNQKLNSHFEQVVAQSKAVSYDDMRNRSMLVRLRDSIAGLMSPYL